MELSLKGLNILIIGGDRREVELCNHLHKMGAAVGMYGFSDSIIVSEKHLVQELALSAELKRAHVIITPLQGIEDEGLVYTPFFEGQVKISDIQKDLQEGTLLLAGYISPLIKESLRHKKIVLYETREMDEISILNAIPTAEGAIQVAMQHTEITIHGSQCFVLGYGRCGRVLAETLKGIGADVTVIARRKEVLSWVLASRMNPLLLDELAEGIHKADIIFNTIPAVVVNGAVLCNVKKEVLIIDLATHPGGIDFAAAKCMGIKAFLLPGLPGKVAPKTAGRILCQVYPSLILSVLKGGNNLESA